jgi:hypothetical protein
LVLLSLPNTGLSLASLRFSWVTDKLRLACVSRPYG